MEADHADVLPVIGVRLVDGRCGSTLLMRLLGSSPQIVFERRYPAEYRLLSYFARMAKNITTPFDESVHPGVTPFFFGSEPQWGPVPFTSDTVDLGALEPALLRAMWSVWSAQARTRDRDAAYYAEKLAIDAAAIDAAGIPLRIIDLVRDPRDVLASIRSFTARGIDGLGRSPGLDEAEYRTRFAEGFAAGLRRIAEPLPASDRLIVRYEDLIGDPDTETARIGDWLGLELHADPATDLHHHMTSASAPASIGRWRTDLDADDLRVLSEHLGSLVTPFGYAAED